VFVFLYFFCFGFNEKKDDRKHVRKEKRLKNYEKVKEIIESRNFIFNAERAFPTGMRSIDLISNPGTIAVKNDSVTADLPFFGRSYSSNYSGDAGMKFEGKIEDEKIETNDKKYKVTYSFSVSDSNDSYDVSIVVSSPESASVNINSRNKASISYSGELKENKKEGKD
jgi:hypothetical protein